ncbi:MAG: FAD-dependent oxidoreductase [Pseudomonadota bacterium]
MTQIQRVVVVGAGIVGVCCAIALRRKGFLVTLVEAETPGCGASYGNAGALAVPEVMPMAAPGLLRQVPGWLRDPLGPLYIRWAHLPKLLPWLWSFQRCGTTDQVEKASRALAALHRGIFDDYLPLFRDAGVTELLHEKGALALYETEAGMRRDALEWETKRACGVALEPVGPQRIAELEPDLAPIFAGGYFMPDWAHVGDPYRIVLALADLAQREGVALRRGQVSGFAMQNDIPAGAFIAGGERVPFEKVVVAAGAWSGKLVSQLGCRRVLLESERGYNTTLPDPGVHLSREIILGEGKFVMTPMDMGLRIGGAAEFAGLDAPPNFQRSQALVEKATRCFPALNAAGGEVWMGHRPSTPDSLPVISPSPHHRNVFFAFGHGHLGLTQAATTGRLVANLATGQDPGIDMEPYRIDRF